jgi:hypothetical protein
MICYNCHEEVTEDEARTIGQCVVVCTPCYHEIRELIVKGYFETPQIEDDLIAEYEIQAHISAWA